MQMDTLSLSLSLSYKVPDKRNVQTKSDTQSYSTTKTFVYCPVITIKLQYEENGFAVIAVFSKDTE